MDKYLEFIVIEQKPKTKVIEVKSKLRGVLLGTIRWFGRWRQYAFFPEVATVFNIECLADIQFYIKKLKEERDYARKEQNPRDSFK